MKQLITRLSIISLLFLSGVHDSLAQQLPNIIPPSPVSMQFQKFLGYPVSPATGTADISIPLYNLQAAGITIPFSLQYHTSGIKVYESPGNIGYGWTLFPGFRISRTIMGKPDDAFKTDDIRNASTYSYAGIDQYLCDIAVSQDNPMYPRDGQYDIFSIHLPNLNTTFILQWINGELTGVPLPNAPVKIKPIRSTAGTAPLYFNYFEVTDDKGNVYIFGKDHKDISSSIWSPTSEWMLEKIIAPGIGNTIDFTYSSSTVPWVGGLTTQYFEVDDAIGYDGGAGCDLVTNKPLVFGNPSSGSSYNDYTYNTWSLTSISFPSGRVDFGFEDQVLSKVNSIKVYNTNNEKVKDIAFSRLSGWNLLNTVSVSGEGQYSFEYDMQPFTYQGGQDFSGYYNGQNNWNLVPTISLTIDPSHPGGGSGTYVQTFSGANRQPDEQKMQSHILKKINYPTGGYTSFNYEAHKFISKGVPSFGMGLRIASTQVYDPVSGKTITNSYTYGQNESGYGELGTGYYVNNQISALDENAFVSEKKIVSCYTCMCMHNASIRRRTVSSSNKFSNFSFNIPVWYPEVSVYSDGGKTTYKYNYTPSYFVNYSQGDTKNYYISELRNLGLSGPKLANKQILSGAGKLLQETSYTYWGGATGITGIIVDPVATYMGHAYSEIFLYPNTPEGSHLIGMEPNPFVIANYTIEKNNDNIATITQHDYQDNNVLETVTTFDYEYPYTYNVKSKSVTNSTNGTTTENYYYPTSGSIPDISSLSSAQQAMLSTLFNNNRLTTVIQKNTIRNNTPVCSNLFGYKDWANSVYSLEQVYSRTGSNPFESRLHYYSCDDKGNVTSVSKENDIKNSYIWGYNQTYPIAQAINAEAKDIFYTSFEDADGNSTDGDSKTGRKSRTGGYSKSLSGLTNGSYILSYWQKNGSTWTLQKNDLAVTTSAYTINISGQVDELRFYPSTAQMTTYTYSPLIGQTSQTDINNNSSYFEYDAFGRLMHIRDKDNNILKKFCYNYAGQQSTCEFVGNTVKSKVYTKTGCDAASGKYGSTVTYTVANNTYFGVTQTDADALAQADVDTKGQAYADANGACLQGVTNDAKSGIFTKNNCAQGGTGSLVTYVVPIGRYAAATKTESNQLADADIAANGQNYANTNGYCTWYNDPQSGAFTKNNCASGSVGSLVTYPVAANVYSSTISKYDANAKALNDVNSNGQAYANNNGSCTWSSHDVSGTYYSQVCPNGKMPLPIYVSMYAGTYTSTISQQDADNQAQQGAQNIANANGTCKGMDVYSVSYSQSYDYVEFYNTGTGSTYYFSVPPTDWNYIGELPIGNYNITFHGIDGEYHNYTTICGTGQSGYGEVTLYGENLMCNPSAGSYIFHID